MSFRVDAGVSSEQKAGAIAGAKSESVDTSALTCIPIVPTASMKNKTSTSPFVENTMFLKHKRRYCRKEGCNSIVKSQGLCQRHGARPKTCKVEGCTKQAQGNFDKMCKAHFKAMKRMTTPIPKVENTDVPPPAQGFSVYDEILPNSLNFVNENNIDTRKLPLIVHLKDGFDTLKPPAWHRNEERRARGMFPIDNPAAQLEGWERELVWMEILVLTGVPGASFRHLARAWGRDKGFHMVLAQFICQRHGDVERKKRHGEKNSNNTENNTGTSGNNYRKKRRKATAKAKPVQNNKVEVDHNMGNGGGNGDFNNEDVGADVWDPSLYGDVDTNEALAAEIFDFTEKEFERVASKYKQGMSSEYSVSTSTSNNSRGITTSTDIVAQAAMTAILGQQQRATSISSTSTGHGQFHHRSSSMLSSVSNGNSKTNNNQDDIIPTPVHVEVTAAATHQRAATRQSQMVPVQILGQIDNSNGPNSIQNNTNFASPTETQSYRDHLASLHGDAIYGTPHQQHIPPRQVYHQHVFQDQSQLQVQVPQIQGLGHHYQEQQQEISCREGQVQGEAASHQILQQQPILYNMHAPAPLPQEIIQTHALGQAQLSTESQPIKKLSSAIPTPTQPTHQSGTQAQPFSQLISYTLQQRQLQQQRHTVANMPAHSEPTQFSQLPLVQQQEQQQQNHHQINVESYPQHKQEQSNSPVPQRVVNVSYDQRQHHLQSFDTTVPTNPLTHTASQQMVHMSVPHQQHDQEQQQHQLQYPQINIVPEPAPVQLVQRAHPQHQLPFPMDEHQQIHVQVQAHSQSNASSIPQISEQQTINHSYPPQQHLDQLMNHHPTHEPATQDPPDAAQHNRTDL